MKSSLPFVVLIFLFVSATAAFAQHKPTIAKEPAWITTYPIDYAKNTLEADAEDGYLDLDYENQVSLSDQALYVKKSIKILSEAGVENSSEVSVNYDPTYEQLSFHKIILLRNGKAIDKLSLKKFKIIQQEKELSRHIYDGSQTAYLLLDDVRKGDVIEYSYSIKGFNPIFKGKYAQVYDCQFGVPVANLYYKLIVPATRNIHIKNNNTQIRPAVDRQPTKTTFEWKTLNVAAVHLETKTPGWYDPFASVSVSEFNNWQEVSQWASALFPRNIALSAPLQQKINEIKNTNSSDAQRIVAALHFVQNDIRYMGIEMGTGSHQPNSPDKIFAQRFGDCKDKSYLLATMLNAMGIEANPILINTVQKRSLSQWLPAANVFDHVTVQVNSNGKTYYFDPTYTLQGGSIDNIVYPDYQVGLVVNPATTNLTTIPFHEKGLTDINEIFTIPDMSGAAQLKVVTRYSGTFADNTRSDFTYNSVAEMKRKYKDFYAAYFQKISADSLTYTDDINAGTFTTYEYYSITNFWKKKDDIDKSTFEPFVISSIMTKPSDQNRTMPFYLSFPVHYKEKIDINLPEDWDVKPFEQKVECPYFNLSASGVTGNKKVTLNYEYENLKDYVPADEASIFFSKYDYAADALGYSLTYNKNQALAQYNTVASPNELGTFPKLYMILALCVVITFLVRRQMQKQY